MILFSVYYPSQPVALDQLYLSAAGLSVTAKHGQLIARSKNDIKWVLKEMGAVHLYPATDETFLAALPNRSLSCINGQGKVLWKIASKNNNAFNSNIWVMHECVLFDDGGPNLGAGDTAHVRSLLHELWTQFGYTAVSLRTGRRLWHLPYGATGNIVGVTQGRESFLSIRDVTLKSRLLRASHHKPVRSSYYLELRDGSDGAVRSKWHISVPLHLSNEVGSLAGLGLNWTIKQDKTRLAVFGVDDNGKTRLVERIRLTSKGR